VVRGREHETEASFVDRCPVCCGVSAMLAPSASSTSALPEDDDTERPMCLALAPAAAAMKAAQVETLKVCARHRRCRRYRQDGCRPSLRRGSQLAHTCPRGDLPIDSFLTRSPTMNPAICAGVSSPRMIWRITCSICRGTPRGARTVRWMASATVICFIVASLREILQHFTGMRRVVGFAQLNH